MTALQEQAINMIKTAPEEDVTYVIGILTRHQLREKKNENKSIERSKVAYKKLMSFCKKGTIIDDYKKDLAEALDKKYEGAG
ncbi:MAG: hypothetical protein IJQ21_07140 [Lachnospiraceae bacterium]|nr:hypothetical protein [Lachnospiraceae bacterium]